MASSPRAAQRVGGHPGRFLAFVLAVTTPLVILCAVIFVDRARPSKHLNATNDSVDVSSSERAPAKSPAKTGQLSYRSPVSQSAEDRLPVADEYRRVAHRPRDPETQRDQVLAKLTGSGPAVGRWTMDASQVFDEWRTTSPSGRSVEFGNFACFAAGCAMAATYRDLSAYQGLTREFQESAQFKSWGGAKFRSGPIVLPSGAVQATWVLYSSGVQNWARR